MSTSRSLRMHAVRLGPKSWLRYCLTLLVCFGPAGSARAGEKYYVLVFGSQTTPARTNYSHSWATFVRVTWEGVVRAQSRRGWKLTPLVGCLRISS